MLDINLYRDDFSRIGDHVMVFDGRWKLTAYDDEPGDLFDLDNDPDEFQNLIDDPDCLEVKKSLIERIKAWEQECAVVAEMRGRI